MPDDFPGDEARETVDRALADGVSHLIFPNVDFASVGPMCVLHRIYPHCTSVAMGLHPTEVRADWQMQLQRMRQELDNILASTDIRVVAIGEVGMDLYWDKTFRSEQQLALAEQMRWATELNLPVIIHCREGVPSIVELLEQWEGLLPRMVFHSFTGTADEVKALRRYGEFYFGANGVVTFKNAESVREAVREIGLEHLLLETDSPYLAPVPKRGSRNESSYLPYIAAKVAEIFGVSISEVSDATTLNARTVFQRMFP